jgi:hypothetical protein
MVSTPYDAAVTSNGEVRLYVNIAGQVDLNQLRSALAYSYAHERDHRTPTDPWEYAFGDARRIESEVMFTAERDRIIRVLLVQIAGDWEADILYYPPHRASALYHWSSTEGMLTPYRTVTVE